MVSIQYGIQKWTLKQIQKAKFQISLMDGGLMRFTSVLAVFQLYQYDGWVVMEAVFNEIPFTTEKFPASSLRTLDQHANA